MEGLPDRIRCRYRALEAVLDERTRRLWAAPRACPNRTRTCSRRWTALSARRLVAALGARGHPVSERTVNRLLHSLGYRLQSNRKTLEGHQHPDRDAQFRRISRQVRAFQKLGQPIISVDTKK